MDTSRFEYALPQGLIAQEPIEPRDHSRLLIVDRKKGTIKEGIFSDLINYLMPGDVLVLNDTQVIPARIMGRKISGARVEILLIRDRGKGRWEALVKPGKRISPGTEIRLGDNASAPAKNEGLPVKVIEKTSYGGRMLKFPSEGGADFAMLNFGQVPLPPYIKKPLADSQRYQTVFSQRPGSLAASTAGLHFTKGLLKKIKNKGVKIVYITLHMGLGSFRPIREERLEEHYLSEEYYEISPEVAERIQQAKAGRGRIVACGTGVVRALETAAKRGKIIGGKGETSLFITPGYKFKIVDLLITNFHLPRSSHLVLASAFAGRELIFQAYQYAISQRFRFYSLGDANLIV